MTYRPGFRRDPTFGDQLPMIIRHREIDPAVVVPVTGAPDHRLWLEHIAVDCDREPIANAGNTTDSLHSSSL
jgi:hypothetical protein